MATQKAGCYLIDAQNKAIALIYREKQHDISFPKGHVERGETLEQTAVRETAEEVKRVAKIVKGIPSFSSKYTTPQGEECEVHMFIAIDKGKSKNTSTDTHELIWCPIEEVETRLQIPNLIQSWNNAKPYVEKVLNSVK